MGIPGVPENNLSLWVKVLFMFLRKRDGNVPHPLAVYAWRPSILFTFLRLGQAIRRTNELEERAKRLAMYWAAQQIECPL